MTKPRIEEVIVVEGKYDAVKLASLVDALILTTGGFSIFSSEETKRLLRKLGAQRGIIVLTDSDAAGFRIRAYLNKLAQGLPVKNAYIPALAGKESRKDKASKEGLLGVEGVDGEVLLRALWQAGAKRLDARMPQGAIDGTSSAREITYADLYALGLSGTQGSAETRRAWLGRIGLPPRLSKKALCGVLNSLYTYEELLSTLPDT